jgi:hypothetical protein
MNFSKLPIVLLLSGLAEVHSHGVAVYSCLSASGALRIFIEHWHGALSSPSDAGTMTIQDNIAGGTITKLPDGIQNSRSYTGLTGCAGGGIPTSASLCIGSAGTEHNWVYYDFPTSCGNPTSNTLLSGNTVVLQEDCSSLYPVTLTGTFNDNNPPTIFVDGQSCLGGSVTITREADYTCNGFTTVWGTQASDVAWTQTTTDDCDTSPVSNNPSGTGNHCGVGNTVQTVTATDNSGKTATCTVNVNVITSTDPCAASPMPSLFGGGYRTSAPTASPTPAPSPFPSASPSAAPTATPSASPTATPSVSPSAAPTATPSASPTEVPSASPTSHITPWLVGPTTYTLNGGNNYFDGFLGCSNVIGSKVTQNVVVQLFDFNCINAKDNMNSTNAVTIFQVNPTPASFGYSVNISQSNIGDDTGGFVFPTGPSTGDVKFCTRVSTWEGSIEVAFRETNFILSYDLTNNNFALNNIQIEENDPDSFITDVDTDFSVIAYQCSNYLQTTSHTLQQDENLVICLEPSHPGGMAHVVHISNFNIKMYAGSAATGDYVEYNPVWFSTGGWTSDSLTAVSEQPDPADIIMISTPVIAQFFIQSHIQINVSGNCFLEFDSAKEARAPVFVGYDMQFAVVDGREEGCLVGLIRRIRGLF